MVYRAICERLETTDYLTDATECFHQMVNELTITEDQGPNWIISECLCMKQMAFL